MPNFNSTQKEVFKTCARSIVHMRRQIEARRFGLVFGSGLSKSFGLPMWQSLVQRIAKDPVVKGSSLLRRFGKSKSLSYQTELLLQHYKKAQSKKSGKDTFGTKEFEYRIIAEWLRLVAKHLYANAPKDFSKTLDDHPYISSFLPIIRQCPLTITYNFDNYLERALWLTRPTEADKLSRGYETVTNPFAQFRRQDSVVFHPNGFYPPELMEVPVDKFVFSEASYAEQFLGVLAGSQTALTTHFAKSTCLLIGLSLEDEMLRNLLVLSANLSPGNYHYYVHFLKKNEHIAAEEKEAIKRTNFYVYNLVTLFLHEDEILALGTLLNAQEYTRDDIEDLSKVTGTPAFYCYYMTGPVGVGKSTTVNQYRNLVVLDEWLEERPAILGKAWKTLTQKQRSKADAWIAKQFELKNENLRREKEGIFLVDRPPLDPLAFTPKNGQRSKAENLLQALCQADGLHVKDGAVILMSGDTRELSARIKATGRDDYTSKKLEEMSSALKGIYRINNVICLDTQGLSVPEVTRKIGEIIHLMQYRPCRLEARLKLFAKGRVSVAT